MQDIHTQTHNNAKPAFFVIIGIIRKASLHQQWLDIGAAHFPPHFKHHGVEDTWLGTCQHIALYNEYGAQLLWNGHSVVSCHLIHACAQHSCAVAR
jgi:hypothetical protein